MTLDVLDFVTLWQYYDPSKYPHPVQVYLDREIYSDPVGTCDDSGLIVLPTRPTQPISQLTVWGGDRIDAVQVTYPPGGGLGRVTQTSRMGNKSGGSNQPPHGGVFTIAADNPIVTAGGLSGDILNALTFTFKNGSTTGKLGGNYRGGNPFSFSATGEILSSIHINGRSQFYNCADSVVFGFKFEQPRSIDVAALGRLYVATPAAGSVEEFAGRFAALPVDREVVTATAAAEDWDAQRAAYRASLAEWKAQRRGEQ